MVMSDSTIKASIQERREQYEIKRLRNMLNERNQQLQIVEQQFSIEQNNLKHSRQNMRLLMVFCVLLIVVLSWGGAA
ncbi:hypothetical protein SAMN05660405_02661 [Psychrobacter pacificensis]|uniref:Uncharacterized protein n=3 Tax=Psychrobacter pacificensis TaxID=112002 RepID=A0A1G7B072_9GAMM|nr:hypothetical protein GCM10007915_12270 [Psychrobacter pacificensis]SDE20320.1 hypothetical protein SAMN05660405_02661 [Psychrobacter pacificensis]